MMMLIAAVVLVTLPLTWGLRPALREIALGINGLVARLNDVLYGPQEHGLVARRPG